MQIRERMTGIERSWCFEEERNVWCNPVKCSVCRGDLDYSDDFARNYPNLVCHRCDARALNSRNEKAHHCGGVEQHNGKMVIASVDDGDNPVYIKGHKCWRRYRFGGYVTMRDSHDCSSLTEFYEKHMKK